MGEGGWVASPLLLFFGMVGILLSMGSDVLDVKNLNVSFQKDGQQLDIIRDLSLKVGEGEILALVGESGSG